MKSPLPYLDTKPQGAADFYFGINATFRYLVLKYGRPGWVTYLADLGRSYYAPVNAQWRDGGLPAVANYWRAFFAAEPGAEVEVEEQADRVEITVKRCPAIHHLREQGRQIVPFYCQHCYYLGATRAQESGRGFRLEGGNGSCRHCYLKDDAALPPQDMAAIKEN